MTKMTQLLIMLLTGLALLVACTATKNSYNPPPVHPPEAELAARCGPLGPKS